MAHAIVNDTTLATGASVLRSEPTRTPEQHEQVYAEAKGDPTRVPWARMRPTPLVETWLNREACGTLRPGARIAVVGCGLGDDVALVAERGYDVSGLDVAPTAIDLVIEAHTLQSVDPDTREAVAAGIVSLARPHGALLIVADAKEPPTLIQAIQGDDPQEDPSDTPDAPTPGTSRPLSEHEIMDLMRACAMAPACDVWIGRDPSEPRCHRLRALFRRVGTT
jgi:SAM-dependent methyltransferase